MASERNNNTNQGGAQYDELLLTRYLDGRLSDKERAAVDELLRTNAAARRMYDALREEESLLHSAMETRSEPSKRLGDKVLATLYNEERFRQNAERNRRLRRQILSVVAIAASFVLCVMLVKPRDAAGTTVSGTVASMLTAGNERKALKKDTNVYEGDQVATAQGQFVRMKLQNAATLDIDENSKLTFDRPAELPVLKLTEGRVALDLRKANRDLLVRVPQGTLRLMAGSHADIWLPRTVDVQWPELLLPQTQQANTAATAFAAPAAITVLDGTVYVANEKLPSGAAVGKGHRVILTSQRREVRKAELSTSRVLDPRTEQSWHTLNEISPQGRTVIGLTARQSFTELGERTGIVKLNEKIASAVTQLQDALKTTDAVERAANLAAGQQQLRTAFEPLKVSEEQVRMGRTLEGLAHFERGRTLLQRGDHTAANAAFLAAQVAFDEAIPPVPAKSKPSWARRLADESILTLHGFSPADESALLATFLHPVAKYWQAATMSAGEARTELALNAAGRFAAIRADLGRSMEAQLVRLGEGLCLTLTDRTDKAAEAFDEVLSASDAGSDDAPRAWINGIKQAALVASVRMYIALGDDAKANAAAHDFWLAYPLNGDAPAAQQIDQTLKTKALNAADEALRRKQYAQAVELYDQVLTGAARNNVELRLKFIRAVIGARYGDRARRELSALEPLVPETLKADFDTLQTEAAALPEKPENLKQ